MSHHQSPSLTLLHFNDDRAIDVANITGIPHLAIDVHRFPDGESKITLPILSTDAVAIYLSLDQPNSKLVELMLVCATLQESHHKPIILIAPYLGYMRQDIAFEIGEAVSQKIIGQFLANYITDIITVDPHLHRTHELVQAVPCKQAINVSSADLQARFLEKHHSDSILVGPDSESEQWVKQIAQLTGLDYLIASKQRSGDHDVIITLPDADLTDRDIILVDDIASTGQTLARCAMQLSSQSVKSINALITHALFDKPAEQSMHQAGIQSIWSADSIKHPTNVISLAPLLADTLKAYCRYE
ncbi:MAG: ribose-phosphate diphosphokinase [Gammaproteobacteria bacterium]|nr:ribose-phosphate diphosphokinase [Gammaproteobacteria bacterium]